MISIMTVDENGVPIGGFNDRDNLKMPIEEVIKIVIGK